MNYKSELISKNKSPYISYFLYQIILHYIPDKKKDFVITYWRYGTCCLLLVHDLLYFQLDCKLPRRLIQMIDIVWILLWLYDLLVIGKVITSLTMFYTSHVLFNIFKVNLSPVLCERRVQVKVKFMGKIALYSSVNIWNLIIGDFTT